MQINTIGERLKTTIKLLSNHCKIYSKFNLINFLIGIILIWLSIQLQIIIGENIITYHSTNNTFLLEIWAYLIGVITIWRLYYSLIFLWNFFITEKILKEEKEPSLKEIWIYIKENLINKIKVDFWMALIYIGLWIVWLIAGVISLFWLIKTGIISPLPVITILLIGIAISITYISISYYLSYYYVFENKKFWFKDFIKSSEITRGYRWWIVGNLIVLIIIIGILNYLIGKILLLIPNVYITIPIKTIWMILINLFFLIYFYLYYKNITPQK